MSDYYTSEQEGTVINYCICCNKRYAVKNYSNAGDLCEKCKNQYPDKGSVETTYSWGQGPEFPILNHVISKECFCCKLWKSHGRISVEYECGNDAHSNYVCINCGKAHIQHSNLICQYDGQMATHDSIASVTTAASYN